MAQQAERPDVAAGVASRQAAQAACRQGCACPASSRTGSSKLALLAGRGVPARQAANTGGCCSVQAAHVDARDAALAGGAVVAAAGPPAVVAIPAVLLLLIVLLLPAALACSRWSRGMTVQERAMSAGNRDCGAREGDECRNPHRGLGGCIACASRTLAGVGEQRISLASQLPSNHTNVCPAAVCLAPCCP